MTPPMKQCRYCDEPATNLTMNTMVPEAPSKLYTDDRCQEAIQAAQNAADKEQALLDAGDKVQEYNAEAGRLDNFRQEVRRVVEARQKSYPIRQTEPKGLEPPDQGQGV